MAFPYVSTVVKSMTYLTDGGLNGLQAYCTEEENSANKSHSIGKINYRNLGEGGN